MGMTVAGASAVEVGSAFFNNISAGEAISAGLPELITRYKAERLAELVGFARLG